VGLDVTFSKVSTSVVQLYDDPSLCRMMAFSLAASCITEQNVCFIRPGAPGTVKHWRDLMIGYSTRNNFTRRSAGQTNCQSPPATISSLIL